MEAIFEIRVTPKSSRRSVSVDADGNVRVCLNSPPADGKANAECIELLSKKIGVAKSYISIRKGEKGRNKTICVSGMTVEAVMEKIMG
ncbi:MAG TPA: DUF167 domain-containing protein [Spirochaetota bacterium]|nr:DUF167 domain-containing protein [Spirochaetota bacterium]HRZ26045.1 DUF167 domain-containing protein [Spirochaetota bacterium]HSA16002.1 DUF167 domain-containing protein [Spirochaetota bacterium]